MLLPAVSHPRHPIRVCYVNAKRVLRTTAQQAMTFQQGQPRTAWRFRGSSFVAGFSVVRNANLTTDTRHHHPHSVLFAIAPLPLRPSHTSAHLRYGTPISPAHPPWTSQTSCTCSSRRRSSQLVLLNLSTAPSGTRGVCYDQWQLTRDCSRMVNFAVAVFMVLGGVAKIFLFNL